MSILEKEQIGRDPFHGGPVRELDMNALLAALQLGETQDWEFLRKGRIHWADK